MAAVHFQERPRQVHPAALPPKYSYVPPTPNNFAPEGSIYDGYEAFKASTTPALYRYSTTFQTKSQHFPASVEAHEETLRGLESSYLELSRRGELPVHASRLEAEEVLAASRHPGWSAHEALAVASRRAGHDLFKPGTASFVERPVNPYFREYVEAPDHWWAPWHRYATAHEYYANPYWWNFVPDVPAERSTEDIPQVHHALVMTEERALFGQGMPWWNWHVVTDQPTGMPTRADFVGTEECAVFKGSLRNNLKFGNMDGWASVRSSDTWLDLSALGGLEMAIRGDGKTYRFIVRTKDTNGTIEYTAVLPAQPSAHRWRTVRVAWSDFRPSYKAGMIAGTMVEQVPPLNPKSIKNFGFGVGDRQWGQFHLEVKYLKAV
eukprot:TRINITY_DN477_c0_g1_i1.p1 TRINITY_DN477_c0_g1~~TRINITY_DN477_c0_g1_i1.p1  ORF type:complete len:378 (-),score=79.92 TRINITY_DN477_c0_g1_i1:275-1408(-)